MPGAHRGRTSLLRVRVTMMLCDAVQVADGKLYILGGGWSMTGPEPTPSAVAVKVDVDLVEADQQHHWELWLEDADGRPVMVPTADGDRPVEVRGDFQVGRPVGVPEGSPVDLPLAVNFGPIPLTPGGRYIWRLSIDGNTEENWRLAFSTRAAAPIA